MKIYVAAGKATPHTPIYMEHAHKLGKRLAEIGATLVQGGVSSGMGGAIYDEFTALSDDVEIVLPKVYSNDILNMKAKKVHFTDSINDRLYLISQMCDYIIIMPGGNGTLDELTNFVETGKAKEHHAKVIIINTHGFYDAYLSQIKLMQSESYISPNAFENVSNIVSGPERAIELIQNN